MQILELKVPPVGVFLVAGVAMWGFDRAVPAAAVELPARLIVIFALLAAAGGIALAGIIAFHRHETTVDPVRPDKATSLVVASIYRHTRNPMYLGLVLLLVAWAAYLANAASLLLVPVFIAYMNRFQIKPEERALQEKFGSSYTRYMSEVRRWL